MRKNALEWTVFGLGLIVIVGLVGYLSWAAVTPHDRPAELRVELGKPERLKKGYRTRVTVRNVGDETAMSVKVKVGDADLDLDYVPRQSEREGYVFTEQPPTEGQAISSQIP